VKTAPPRRISKKLCPSWFRGHQKSGNSSWSRSWRSPPTPENSRGPPPQFSLPPPIGPNAKADKFFPNYFWVAQKIFENAARSRAPWFFPRCFEKIAKLTRWCPNQGRKRWRVKSVENPQTFHSDFPRRAPEYFLPPRPSKSPDGTAACRLMAGSEEPREGNIVSLGRLPHSSPMPPCCLNVFPTPPN